MNHLKTDNFEYFPQFYFTTITHTCERELPNTACVPISAILVNSLLRKWGKKNVGFWTSRKSKIHHLRLCNESCPSSSKLFKMSMHSHNCDHYEKEHVEYGIECREIVKVLLLIWANNYIVLNTGYNLCPDIQSRVIRQRTAMCQIRGLTCLETFQCHLA